MDPDETLRELRALVARVRSEQRISQADVERGAELFEGLDSFMSAGGFMPVAWQSSRRPLFSAKAKHGGFHNGGFGGSAAEHGGE
ncbi:HNH endonuclease [Mycobacterium phage Imvubu]|uniref:Uncharacterized protein n=1 Tax=Mycobacterium phage Imvubu TaxID=2686233 RepID=A0A6B9LDW4_9CAUD|nr:HNH endonuclease [Mycobacterium phage Imvubu]QHB37831.1 hypothetical protein PBI_IMVUBU_91 [Mycobacterium phage Imvubu]